MKKCIVYFPFYINESHPSATNIRPIKFIEGFKEAGYEVEVIKGYGKERKDKINEVKRKIAMGYKYDFMYTESATEPTLLTEKNHIPKFPFLDFSFFKYCKENNIPIGLFYRDIYWKFDLYKKSVSFYKRIPAYVFYYYDLLMYKKYLNVLFLPSLMMKKYIPINIDIPTYQLPSGCEAVKAVSKNNKENSTIKILYIGGIDKNLYNIEPIVEAVYNNNNFSMDICCRENEWNQNKEYYEKYLNNRIHVIHKKGRELDEVAMKADLFSLVFSTSEYRKFAMPMKLFSYISYGKPILGIKDTAAGAFIEENNIGYVVNYNKKEIEDLLSYLEKNFNDEIDKKIKSLKVAYNNNTWRARAETVSRCLYKN